VGQDGDLPGLLKQPAADPAVAGRARLGPQAEIRFPEVTPAALSEPAVKYKAL
jgi:hypothetical protein